MIENNNFYNPDTNNNIFNNRDENIMNIHNLNNSFNGTRRHISKKRNYFEFIKQYQQIHDISQNESSNKIFYSNFKKYMDDKLSKTNQDSLIHTSQPFIKKKASSIVSASQINEQKKYYIDEDIEINENNNSSFKKNKKSQKLNLSSSYFLDEDPGFFSDLEDTKESSFSSLNFSFDYPEISIDSIKGKFITNAIELEKTFYRFFNVKILPNK